MPSEFIDRIDYLNSLISKEATGTPRELALKLRISERAVYNYIQLLKSRDAPIFYDRKRNSYCYSEDGTFQFTFIRKKEG